MKYQSQFMQNFKQRGYLYQCTHEEELDARAQQGRMVAYIGFDATANSLHVGSLIQIMILRLLQKCGHKPIVLMGGGTSLVGDPSGKDESRQMITQADIAKNIEGIKKIFSQFLTFGDGDTDAIIVNNADWLCDLQYIDFLRDIGKHFSVNRMINFESVKLRLDREQPLSFLEFNYMVLQAYDFMELGRRYDCDLQIGGADQWGNIVCGIDLGRRVEGANLYGLTTPLLTTSSGAKMGKSASGAVWLNEERLSAYDYWQFWRNTEDADVARFLRLFTELPESEIAKLEKLQGSEINSAKIVLADEVCRLCHGAEASALAHKTAADTFGAAGVSEDLPRCVLSADGNGSSDRGLLVAMKALGFTSSNSEGRRFVEQGAVKVNDEVIRDASYVLPIGDGGVIKLSVGKKKHGLIEFN